MSFGIQNPYSYKSKTHKVIHPDDYFNCQCCGRALTENKHGQIPVAAAKFDVEIYLVCGTCYRRQLLFLFGTFEELKEYIKGHNVRSELKKKVVVDLREPSKKPPKATATHDVLGSIERDLVDHIEKELDKFKHDITNKIRYVFAIIRSSDVATHEPDAIITTHEVATHKEATCEENHPWSIQTVSDDDDEDFGMTDEQRAKFEALLIAEPRPLPSFSEFGDVED